MLELVVVVVSLIGRERKKERKRERERERERERKDMHVIKY
jgi:hypothetical protein